MQKTSVNSTLYLDFPPGQPKPGGFYFFEKHQKSVVKIADFYH